MFNNAYQNLELKIDLSSGGTIAGLKDKIKSILGNKILILCGLLISGVQQLPAVCEPKIYVTQTEEPEDWDEEEDGEFVPEDVYHLEASNIYGYDIAIEDDVVTCKAYKQSLVDIVDSDGNPRFIEGDLNLNTAFTDDYEVTYSKWSLSGTHLMIVIAFKAKTTKTYSTVLIGNLTGVPQWLYDKIFPSGDTEKQVAVQYADQWIDTNIPQTKVFYCGLQKPADDRLQLATWGSKSIEADTYFRIGFDILID